MNNDTLPNNEEVADQEELSAGIMDQSDMMDQSDTMDQAGMMEQLEEYLSEGEYDYQLPERGDIHMGVVIEISDRGAIVDAGFKRDGIVPASDLDRLDDESLEAIQAGDEIAVAVTKPQDEEGRLILSIYQALVQEDWREAERMLEQSELYEGTISGFNRGGLLVPFGRIRGFIPASHTVGMPRGLQGDERRERLADMVGDEVGLKIIEVDRHRRRLILSQRQARRAWQKIQRKRVMEELTEGESVAGTVTGITDFGAFVDLGGADGLIHISELSWRQVDDPREVVEVGDEVEVYVLNLDWDRTRIALSLKRLNPNPWTQVADHYEVGELVQGKVSRVLDFGAFVELDLGVEGLLHISEISGASQLSPQEILSMGQKVLVKIIGIDTRKQRITLSARQVHRDQWEQWMAENQVTAEDESMLEPSAEVEAEEAAATVAEGEAAESEEVSVPVAEGEEQTEPEEAPAPVAEQEEQVEPEEASAPAAEEEEQTESEEAPAPVAVQEEQVEPEEASAPAVEEEEQTESEEAPAPVAEQGEQVEPEEASAPAAEEAEQTESEETPAPVAEQEEQVEPEEASAPAAEEAEQTESEETPAPVAEQEEQVEPEKASAPATEEEEEEEEEEEDKEPEEASTPVAEEEEAAPDEDLEEPEPAVS